MRTNVYIDGFNFYYGALQGQPWKWLDMEKFCRNLLLPRHQLNTIKYFTARVHRYRSDPGQAERQNTYLRALKHHCPRVEILYGHFLRHMKTSRLVTPLNGRHAVEVWNTEEKGSDVNLAVHLLNDAWLDAYDCAVVVTNDSDIAGGMKLVKQYRRRALGFAPPLLNGKRKPSQELRKYTDFTLRITQAVLRQSQLPAAIPGTKLRKPERW